MLKHFFFTKWSNGHQNAIKWNHFFFSTLKKYLIYSAYWKIRIFLDSIMSSWCIWMMLLLWPWKRIEPIKWDEVENRNPLRCSNQFIENKSFAIVSIRTVGICLRHSWQTKWREPSGWLIGKVFVWILRLIWIADNVAHGHTLSPLHRSTTNIAIISNLHSHLKSIFPNKSF